jgi:hypothetical protein
MKSTVDLRYSELDSAWVVDGERNTFSSRIEPNHDYQRIIFDETFRDGIIAAEMTIRSGKSASGEPGSETSFDARVAAIIFRFQNSKNYYFAGVGGHGNKFFISKMIEGQGQPIAATGDSRSIERAVPYRIEVRCSGNRLSLAHNNIVHLQVFDNTFQSGQWGLQAWRTKAEFRVISNEVVKPNCFVIMPFASEFDEVYQVIRETVESHSYDCIRADERYLIGTIMDDVNEQIERADLIVADLTGRNPNVFYEVGYAAALRKPVIQIAQSASDLPFDVRHLRTFPYSTKILGDRKLARDLSEAIRATA